MTDEELNLLRAVLADPASDVPRLVMADWLEEHDQPERSELIRVQCKLANEYHEWVVDGKSDHFLMSVGGEYTALRRREFELIHANAFKWEQRLLGSPFLVAIDGELVGQGGVGTQALCYRYSRGFIEQVEASCADFMKYAKAIFARNPIAKVLLRNKRPVEIGGIWNWMANEVDERESPWFVTERIWNFIELPIVDGFAMAKYSPSEKAVLDALSAASVAYGRSLLK